MDASTLERLAITTLSEKLLTTQTIDPNFFENDKTPSWDGELIAYKSSTKEKNNIYGICKVQIKGKAVSSKELERKKIQYRVFLSDLNNYRFNGGVLFFVVGITETFDRKVYYKELLPYELADIISRKKEQKTCAITLKDMPIDSNKVEHLIHRFIRNSREQFSTTPLHPIGLSEYLTKHNEGNVLSFTVDFPDMFETSTWLYSSPQAQLHIKEPIGKIRIVEMGFRDSSLEVYVRDKCYFDIATVAKRARGFVIYLGGCIEINVEDDKKANCKFIHKGTIDDVLNGLHFFLDFMQGGEIKVISKSFGEQLIYSGTKDSEQYITEIKSDIECYTHVKEILLQLNVRRIINVNDFSKDDLQFLCNMYKYVVKKEKQVVTPDMHSEIKVYTVGPLTLAFVFINQDNQGQWLDFFDYQKFTFFLTDKNGMTFKSSFFLRLQKQHFLKWDNINYSAIEASIMRIPTNDFNCVNTNMLLLEMLSAYDESSNQALLQSVINLSKYLQERRNETVYILNYFQAICRQRPLNMDERERLIMLRQQEKDNAILAGISAILGNKEEYELYLSKLSPELRQQFISFPINNLVSNEGA